MIGAALLGGSALNREVGSIEKSGSIPDPQTVRVLAVVDGDTIRVRFVSGAIGRVRYIGIDTPETQPRAGRPTCFAAEATRANQDLVGGRQVRLEFDRDRMDRFDRLLAYVYVGDTFVNAALVSGGFARPLRIAPNTEYAERFTELARAAQRAKRGLWKACSP